MLVMQQPDLGTSLVFMAILLGMIFISGISWKILVPIFGSAVAVDFGYFLFCALAAGNFRKIFRC